VTRLSLFSPVLAAQLSPRLLRALHARFGGLDALDLAAVAHDRLAVARFLFGRVLPRCEAQEKVKIDVKKSDCLAECVDQ
jgi:hypothetical protein